MMGTRGNSKIPEKTVSSLGPLMYATSEEANHTPNTGERKTAR
jgi:hypothetical protein